MYLKTLVYEREIFNELVNSFKDGVESLVKDLVSVYDEDPFDEEQHIIEVIDNLDFSKNIDFEIEGENCGISIRKSKDAERCTVWSNENGNFDGVVGRLYTIENNEVTS